MNTASETPEPEHFHNTVEQILSLTLELAASSPMPECVLYRREGLNKVLKLLNDATPHSWEYKALSGLFEAHMGAVTDLHARLARALIRQEEINTELLQTLKVLNKKLELLDAYQEAQAVDSR